MQITDRLRLYGHVRFHGKSRRLPRIEAAYHIGDIRETRALQKAARNRAAVA